jgi:hypothetical protein
VHSTVASSSYTAPTTTVNLNDAVLTDPTTRVYVVATRDGLWPNGPGYVVARDYGTNRAALEAADAVAVAAGKELRITYAYTVDDDVTLASPKITVQPGVPFSVSTGKTLIISGSIEADPHQIFAGLGSVAIAGNQKSIYSSWFPGADIGAKINAAVASVAATATTPIVITSPEWCGATYGTGIVINKPVEVKFPGLRNAAATYTGTVAGIKMTANGVRLSGGLNLDLTGNVNATADGVVFYACSDCLISDGISVVYAPRRGISFDAAGVGAYQNMVNGSARVWSAGTGGSQVWFGDSVGAFAANSNHISHLTLNGIPNSGIGVHLSSGYGNRVTHLYSNGGIAVADGGDGTAWAIKTEAGVGGQNYIGSAVLEGPGKGILANGGSLLISQLYNNVAGTAETVDRPTAALSYSYTTNLFYEGITARYFSLSNVGTLTPRASTPTMQSTVLGGTAPFDETGNLIIAPRCDASPRDIHFMTGAYSAGVSESSTALMISRHGAIQGLRVNNPGTLAGPVGSGTLSAAATTTVISNGLVTLASKVFIMPTSANAAAAVGSAGGVYLSAKSAGTSFTLTHNGSVGASATFDYWLIN